MPIKLPKAFPRRKSSTNALEDVQTPPPQPSFRVFERPPGGTKSFDGGNTLRRMSQGRPLSAGQYLDDGSFAGDRPSPILKNRGSGGTQNSSASSGLNDTFSTSARFSSSSTLPSTPSIEDKSDGSTHAHPKTLPSLPSISTPSAQSGFLLRAGGRTFSFGRKTAKSVQQSPVRNNADTDVPDMPDMPHGTRSRAVTDTSIASASTATPPRLLDTDLNFGSADDSEGFGNMFTEYGSRNRTSRSPDNLISPSNLSGSGTPKIESNLPRTRQLDQSSQSSIRASYMVNRSPYTPPPPLNVDRTRQIAASPYSNDSHNSRDGLMNSSPNDDREQFRYDDLPLLSNRQSFPSTRSMAGLDVNTPTGRTRQQPPGAEQRRKSTFIPDRTTSPLQDTKSLLGSNNTIDRHGVNGFARAVLEDLHPRTPVAPSLQPRDLPALSRKPVAWENSGREIAQHPSVSLADNDDADSLSNWRAESINVTPRAKRSMPAVDDDSVLYDPTLQELARSAEQYQSTELPSIKSVINKVMTREQFERYRKEKDLSRSLSDASGSEASDGSGDEYEDDDEERNRELAKQRRKQEAHLAVYRQQMMKVTGETPAPTPFSSQKRPQMDRLSQSTPNLAMGMSNITISAPDNNKPSDDEDDDIPLGILAAHGFPSKEKPPTASGMESNSTIRYHSESYPPPPASTAGGVQRGDLPPFARNLPKDPYYGASIVNPPNRQSLAFGNSGAGSVYGGSQSLLPAGGLVQVIASEEKARAMRRGSPNAQGGYDAPNPGMPLPPGMGMPTVGGMSPGEQAQVQMSQQMQQMMQMQMQFMQQMMAMQGAQTAQPSTQAPFLSPHASMMNGGFLAPPGSQVPMVRPVSMGSHSAPNTPGLVQNQPRTMSMLSPSMTPPWAQSGNRASVAPSMMNGGVGPANGYTPSIAPSERSNVGQPSRYRPVSLAPVDEAANTSRLSTFSSVTTALQGWNGNGESQATVKIVDGKKSKVANAGSEEDDEEGWEEMKMKAEKKKNTWRLKKKDDRGGMGEFAYLGAQ